MISPSGLAVVFAEDTEGQVQGPGAIAPETDWDKLCPKWDALPAKAKWYSVTDKLPQPQ